MKPAYYRATAHDPSGPAAFDRGEPGDPTTAGGAAVVAFRFTALQHWLGHCRQSVVEVVVLVMGAHETGLFVQGTGGVVEVNAKRERPAAA
jgi:hypothetical protein